MSITYKEYEAARVAGRSFNRFDQDYMSLEAADLRGAELDGANLRMANLSGADLSHADLSYADLSHTNLSHADLSYADLSHANLSHAYLRQANLSHAYLRQADLRYAYLRQADLRYAYLRQADLRYADLSEIVMNWNSHNLIAERLYQVAKTDKQLFLVGIILIGEKQEWCWKQLLEKAEFLPDEKEWAMDMMQTWIKEDDNLPIVLGEWKKESAIKKS